MRHLEQVAAVPRHHARQHGALKRPQLLKPLKRVPSGLKSTQRQTGEAFMVGVHGGAVQVARIETRVERAPGFSA